MYYSEVLAEDFSQCGNEYRTLRMLDSQFYFWESLGDLNRERDLWWLRETAFRNRENPVCKRNRRRKAVLF